MRLYLLLLCTILTSALMAQDPTFSQFFAAPLDINPAFTGLTYRPKFHLNYRNQWPSVNAYSTYAASADQYFHTINSGFGMKVKADVAGNGIYNRQFAGLIYSYNVEFRREKQLKFGIEAGVIRTALDWNKLIFYDQLDPTFGTNIPGGLPSTLEERPDNLNQTTLDISAGVLYHTKNFYAGLGAFHLNSPEENFLARTGDADKNLPIRMVAHAGYTYAIQEGNRFQKGVYIIPTVMYINQGQQGQVNAGAIANIKGLMGGMHFRHVFDNADALIFFAGYEYEMLRIGYSFDYTLSELGIGAGGAHELSLTINLDYKGERQVIYSDCFKLFR